MKNITGKKLLVIGAGGVGNVFVRKAARCKTLFSEIHLASRTQEKCERIKASCDMPIHTYAIDADDSKQVVELIKKISPDLVVNLALPYQDLSIMDACLEGRVSYMDTANYEPPDEAKYSYQWQWDYHEKFKSIGKTALLGSGFDPGVTSVFCAYAEKHIFDEIHTVDILDCNGGDHGHFFATNFNPEINIREITQKGKYFENGEWIETDALSESKIIDFPEIGKRKAYLMYHEELESLVKHFPSIKKIRFYMTFSEQYLNVLNVLEKVGMTSIEPVQFEGKEVVPIQFLKTILPNPESLAENYTGKTCIGCLISGIKNGEEKTVFIYNVCDHEECFRDVGSQAISFTTGVPALIGAQMLVTGQWKGEGVYNVEQFDPDPFLSLMPEYGLEWSVKTVNETFLTEHR